MSGFTPGPWNASICDTSPLAHNKGWGVIAVAPMRGRIDSAITGMSEADARLIAAAPRMYEALKTKLKWCREHGDCADAALMGDEYCSDECVAMAAVLTEIGGKSNVKA